MIIPTRLQRLLTPIAVAALLITSACSDESDDAAAAAPGSTSAQQAAAPDAPDPKPKPVTKGPYTWDPGVNPDDYRYLKCWAALRATPSRQFPNPYDNIKGPVEIAYLRDLDLAGRRLNHTDWAGHVTAVTAGPTARVTIYADEDLRGRSHVVESGEKVSIADTSLDSVGSIRIEYAP